MYKLYKPYLDIDFVKSKCELIHYFGLGFIQIKLQGYRRLHIYTGAFPVTTEHPHNHRYGLNAVVIWGKLKQTIFKEEKGFTHLLSYVNCGSDQVVPNVRVPCSLEVVSEMVLSSGSSYYLHSDSLHTVESNSAITLLSVESNPLARKPYAQVVIPVGQEDTCPFLHTVEEKDLWEIVEIKLKEALMEFEGEKLREALLEFESEKLKEAPNE